MRHLASFLLVVALLAATPLQASSPFDDCFSMTGSSATLIVPADALTNSDISLSVGSELALYTPSGACAGHAVWEGGTVALAIWQDDPQTNEQDGFLGGEELRLAAWDAASNSAYEDVPAQFDATYTDEPVFASDAVYLVSALGASTSTDTSDPALAFDLEPNFPNPFVDATTIRYAVAHETNVTVSVYNLLGQRVAELVNERQQPGGYEVTFRPPSNLSSGTYLYRLATDTYTEHHRMVLVR